MPLNAASAELMTTMAAMGVPPIAESTPDDVRAVLEVLRALSPPGPDMARVSDVVVDTPDGGTFTVRVLVPHGDVRGVMVYYHGGGWVIGSIEGHDAIARKLADVTGYAIVNVDYRLAPEHPYPTSVEDATTAFEWAAANLDVILGGDASTDVPLVVAGDSAGGNLATVVARRMRDRGGPSIAMQVLIYPITDSDTETASYLDPENQLFIARDTMLWFFGYYIPDAAQRDEPDVSPLQIDDLSGLPPAFVLTAEYDPLRDEGEAYAERLRDSGVPTTLVRLDGEMHGFFSMVTMPGHEVAVDEIAAAMRSGIPA